MKKTTLTLMASLFVATVLAVPVWAGGDLPNLPANGQHEVYPSAADTVDAEEDIPPLGRPCTAVIEDNVPPLAEPCAVCGTSGIPYYETEYTSWANIYLDDCVHHTPHKKDRVQERSVIKTYRCSNCQIDRVICSKETRPVHP